MDKQAGCYGFSLQKAADGVWAALAAPGSGTAGNGAVIDLGDRVLVVDTFCLPQAAARLREQAEQLTGNPVTVVVNTHFHGDHHYGNQMFEDCLIISTEQTRQILAANPPLPVEAWQAALQNQMDSLKAVHSQAAETSVRLALADEINDKSALREAVPEIRRVPASVTFTDEMELHGSVRSVRIMSYGGGHTKSDAFVYVPDAKLLVAGDLVLSSCHPAMLHGSPAGWIEILQRMERELEVERVIPGHGNMTDRRSLADMLHYLEDIQAYAQQAADSGETVDQWLARGIPEEYSSWQAGHVFEWNFRWLYNQRLSTQGGSASD